MGLKKGEQSVSFYFIIHQNKCEMYPEIRIDTKVLTVSEYPNGDNSMFIISATLMRMVVFSDLI